MTQPVQIDQDLVAAVIRGSDAPTPEAAVEAVLRKHLLLCQQEALRELRGSVTLWPGYDHKVMREKRAFANE